jgi:hypothetical protein
VPAGMPTRGETGPLASGLTLLEPGHVQTREVSPRKRAADRSLHAETGCFFHSDLAVHRSQLAAGVAAAEALSWAYAMDSAVCGGTCPGSAGLRR